MTPTAAARGILELAGHKSSRYVPGSLHITRDGHMDWTEQCRAKCPHESQGCHVARSGLVPTGFVEDPS